MEKFVFNSENYFVKIDNVKHPLYQGDNKNPFYYLDNKEIYLNPNDKKELDIFIKTTVKAV